MGKNGHGVFNVWQRKELMGPGNSGEDELIERQETSQLDGVLSRSAAALDKTQAGMEEMCGGKELYF